jgi:natural product precursor
MSKKLSLIELSKEELKETKGGKIKYGGCCCGCYGPSSEYWNFDFNWADQLSSPGC